MVQAAGRYAARRDKMNPSEDLQAARFRLFRNPATAITVEERITLTLLFVAESLRHKSSIFPVVVNSDDTAALSKYLRMPVGSVLDWDLFGQSPLSLRAANSDRDAFEADWAVRIRKAITPPVEAKAVAALPAAPQQLYVRPRPQPVRFAPITASVPAMKHSAFFKKRISLV